MNITAIIEKIKQNLELQEEMKIQLRNIEEKILITEEKISYESDNLVDAEANLEELGNYLKSESANEAFKIAQNLKIYVIHSDNGEKKCNFKFLFMDKQFTLLSEDEAIILPEINDTSIASMVPYVVEKYFKKGDAIFDDENIVKLKEMVDLYDKNTNIVTSKLENTIISKKVKNLQQDLECAEKQLEANNEELLEVEAKLQKCKDFNSALLQKVFSRKLKLQNLKVALERECETNEKVIEKTKTLLEDKSSIKEEAKSIVNIELSNLLGIVAWVNSFEKLKEKLVDFKNENVESVKARLEDLQDSLLNTQMKYSEFKGILQLSKKINNEIISNALQSKKFIDAFAVLDLNIVSQEDIPAVKYIGAKYNELVKSQVEKFTK